MKSKSIIGLLLVAINLGVAQEESLTHKCILGGIEGPEVYFEVSEDFASNCKQCKC